MIRFRCIGPIGVRKINLSPITQMYFLESNKEKKLNKIKIKKEK